MVEINYKAIYDECNFDDLSNAEISKKIVSFEESYDIEGLVSIYNYFLQNSNNIDVLLETIKQADKYKNVKTFGILIDILLMQNRHFENKDDFINVRAMCAKAISNYKDTSVVGSLLYCLNNKNEHYKIRLACADALGRIGDKYAVAPLIDVVKDEDEKSIYLKESATFALGLLGDVSAVDPLVTIMEAKQNLLGKFSFLKEKIIEALGKLNVNNLKVLHVFKNSLMDSSPMVRINAIEGLMNSDFEEANELIRQTMFNDEDLEVQKNALIALYNMEGKSILDEILCSENISKYLKDEAQNLLNEYEEEEDE